MKRLYALFILITVAKVAFAQSSAGEEPPHADTIKKGRQVFIAIEQAPSFPGGDLGFKKYIQYVMRVPEIAKLIGVTGRVRVSFTVAKDGTTTNAKALDTIGSGCEQEAVRIVLSSPKWRPGIQNSVPVDVRFVVPIVFSMPKNIVAFDALKQSDYGFIFEVKGKLLTIKEAETMFGAFVPSADVDIALPYITYITNNNPQFLMPDKKEVYLIKMKN